MRWLVTMGPHRFLIEASSKDAADTELDTRLARLSLERRDPEFHELTNDGQVVV